MKRIFKVHLVSILHQRSGRSPTRLAPCNPALNTSRYGKFTASVGNMYQGQTKVIIKFLTYIYSKPTLFQFETICPCLSLKALVKTAYLPTYLPKSPLTVFQGHNQVSPDPSLFHAEHPDSLSVFTGQVFQPRSHFPDPPMDPFQLYWGFQKWMQHSGWAFMRVE